MHELLLSAASLLAEPVDVPTPPDPRELELVWRAPERCPTQADILRRLDVLLPGDSNGEGVLHVECDVTVDPSGARLQLVSTFRGTTERREITADDCGALGEATAVLLAVALEPSARGPESPPKPAPTVTEPPIAEDPVEDPIAADPVAPKIAPIAPVTTTTPTRRAPLAIPSHFGLRIAGGLEVGGVPPPSGAVQLAGLVLWRRARLEIHAAYLPPRRRAEARYQLVTAGARGCGRLFAREVEFPLCLGAEAGLMRGRADGRPAVNGPWLGVLASAGVSRAWGPVAIWAAVEGLGSVLWTEFRVDGDLRFKPSAVSMRALFGIELRASWKRGGRGQ
ncbi:MAG TPA: hypothetical protein VG755_14675 [Nannocystaceae bacterium]|nr:hypothetical protein [Nannocystaceae bacterium]